MKLNLIVVLICISLMTDNAEYLFTCLLPSRLSSLEKRLFMPFAHFLIMPLVFLLSFRSPLYVLDIKSLLNI